MNFIISGPEDQPPGENSFTSFNPKYAGSLNTSTQSMFPNYRPNVEESKIQRQTNRSMFTLPKLSTPNFANFKQDKTDAAAGSIKISINEIIAIIMLSTHALIKGLIIGLATSQVNLWQLFSGMKILKSTLIFYRVSDIEMCLLKVLL